MEEKNQLAEARKERNEKIIRAVIAKAERDCPGSLDLVAVNGSFATGKFHPRSDLDLLIVVKNEAGTCLAEAFVEEDTEAAHDLWCMTWERLRGMAEYEHPHIAKLLDSAVVWTSGKEAEDRLEGIRAEARANLAAPFGEKDLAKAEGFLRDAEHCFVMAALAGTLSEVRRWSAGAVICLEDALTMLNKKYYRLGVRDRYRELAALERKPEDLCALIESVVRGKKIEEIRTAAADLMRVVEAVFEEARISLATPKKTPGPGDLEGTYEEMFSNWRGKMHLAAETGDRHLAFSSLVSFRSMLLDEIGAEYEIGEYDVMAAYDPEDLRKTEAGFDELLFRYGAECERAGVKLRKFRDVDAFVRDYLGETGN